MSKHYIGPNPALSGAVILTLALLATLLATPAPAASQEDERAVHFLVDTSGSMGGTPLQEAKTALSVGIDALEDGQAAGLREFSGSCAQGGRRLVDIGTDNRDALRSAVAGLSAGGSTPTPQALIEAAADLPDRGDRTIVLISDGQSTCGDPCPVADDLADKLGVSFRVHSVGFRAPDAAADELSCIADATGGTYVSASDREELERAITGAVSGESLNIDVQVSDWPLLDTYANEAFVLVSYRITEPSGELVDGATVSLSNRDVTYTAHDGTLRLLERVQERDLSFDVEASHDSRKGQTSVDVYRVHEEGICNYEGRPSRLNRLKGVLSSTTPHATGGAGKLMGAIKALLDAVGLTMEAAPPRGEVRTTVRAYTVDVAEPAEPIYLLSTVTTIDGSSSESSLLFSRDDSVITPLTEGSGLMPIEQFGRMFNCSTSGPVA